MTHKEEFLARVEAIITEMKAGMSVEDINSQESKDNEATIRGYIARQNDSWFLEANKLNDGAIMDRIFGAAFGECIDLCGGK